MKRAVWVREKRKCLSAFISDTMVRMSIKSTGTAIRPLAAERGTLISECWILTVANCTFSLSTESQVAALPNVLQHLDRYFMESEYVFQRTNSSCWEQHKKFFDRLVHMDAVLLLHTKRILLKKRTQCESLLQKLRFLIVSGRKI